jgi:hypothetical protein
MKYVTPNWLSNRHLQALLVSDGIRHRHLDLMAGRTPARLEAGGSWVGDAGAGD